MKSRLAVAVAAVLSVIISGPISAIGQDGSDDEMPIGIPDLMIYADGDAEVRSDIDSTFDRAAGLNQLESSSTRT